jgi:hypothetical protein
MSLALAAAVLFPARVAWLMGISKHDNNNSDNVMQTHAVLRFIIGLSLCLGRGCWFG